MNQISVIDPHERMFSPAESHIIRSGKTEFTVLAWKIAALRMAGEFCNQSGWADSNHGLFEGYFRGPTAAVIIPSAQAIVVSDTESNRIRWISDLPDLFWKEKEPNAEADVSAPATAPSPAHLTDMTGTTGTTGIGCDQKHVPVWKPPHPLKALVRGVPPTDRKGHLPPPPPQHHHHHHHQPTNGLVFRS